MDKQNGGAPTPTHIVGGDVLDAPHRCSHYLTATRRILINVCRVWFGSPPPVCSHRLFLRTVEDACPYNKWGDLVRRHIVGSRRLFAKRETKRLPYKRDFIQRRCVVRTYPKPSPVGEGGSRRLTDEVSVSLFALSFGFAQTNDCPQTL